MGAYPSPRMGTSPGSPEILLACATAPVTSRASQPARESISEASRIEARMGSPPALQVIGVGDHLLLKGRAVGRIPEDGGLGAERGISVDEEGLHGGLADGRGPDVQELERRET